MYQINISNKYSECLVRTPSVEIMRMIIKCFELKYGAIDFVKIVIK